MEVSHRVLLFGAVYGCKIEGASKKKEIQKLHLKIAWGLFRGERLQRLFFYSLQIYLWHSQERVIRCVWRLLEDHFDDFFIPIHFYSILIEMVCMAMRDVNDCHDLRDLVMVNTLWFT